MNIRKYFIAINCTLSHKAFVFSPPLGEVGKGLPLTTDEWELCGHSYSILLCISCPPLVFLLLVILKCLLHHAQHGTLVKRKFW